MIIIIMSRESIWLKWSRIAVDIPLFLREDLLVLPYPCMSVWNSAKSCAFKQNNPRESGAFLKPYSPIERNAQTTEIIGFIFIYVWAVCGYRPTNNGKRRIYLLHPLQLQVSGNMKIWILILNFKTNVSWCFNIRCECRYDNAQCLTHSQYKDVCMVFWIR